MATKKFIVVNTKYDTCLVAELTNELIKKIDEFYGFGIDMSYKKEYFSEIIFKLNEFRLVTMNYNEIIPYMENIEDTYLEYLAIGELPEIFYKDKFLLENLSTNTTITINSEGYITLKNKTDYGREYTSEILFINDILKDFLTRK